MEAYRAGVDECLNGGTGDASWQHPVSEGLVDVWFALAALEEGGRLRRVQQVAAPRTRHSPLAVARRRGAPSLR